MMIKSVELVVTAFDKKQYPSDSLLQIAVVGRSNVGKSSFINAILNRRNYARVSSKPGKTRGINFYKINNMFYIVDLPGYGYAAVSKEMKKQWGLNIETYFKISDKLKYVLMLVDIRHLPTEDDIIMVNYLKNMEIPFTIIATKSDKLSKTAVQKSIREIAMEFKISPDIIVPFSSLKKQGVDEVLMIIEKNIKNQELI